MARSERGRELEFHINTMISVAGDLQDVKAEGAKLVDLIDDFSAKLVADTSSGSFTAEGLRRRVTTHGAELMKAADRLDGMATTIEDQAAASFDAEWAKLTKPASDVLDFLTLDRIAGRLRDEDQLVRDNILQACARRDTRDDLTLRAALTDPAPPFSLGVVGEIRQHWTSLVSPETLQAIQATIRDRVSPQGSDAFFADAMRTFAQFARGTVVQSSTVGTEDPIKTMATTGLMG